MPALRVPELSLVVLIGPSGSGKSTFARRHFLPTEVLSSDACRGIVSDDENDQGATNDAFEVLHFLASKRLDRRRLTVVDATNVQSEARKPLVDLARRHHALPVAIVFAVPESLCHERNRERADRSFGPHVIRNQARDMRMSLRRLEREGFRVVHVLRSAEEVDGATIDRVRLWNDRRDDHGPFDFVGDVHGCFDELRTLLERLGYVLARETPEGGEPRWTAAHPEGRKAVFVGDLVDRGPATPEVLRLVMDMTASGSALCVPGNHDVKLMRKLRGRDVRITHGLAESLEQLSKEPEAFSRRAADFIDALVAHYVLDDGKVVVAHAGLKAELQGRASGAVREFALFGDTTGETDEFGLPVRYPWAAEYRGPAMVVYGHTPVPEPEWLNGTINIDTGCVFGGRLTALRYPERELVSVPAAHTYYAPAKPFLAPDAQAPALSAQQQNDDMLDMEDVSGKRLVSTRLAGPVTIRAENAAAALEVMARFALDPKWLVYLPPTMSPTATSTRDGLLEHPDEAFAYYRQQGIDRVVCEEKHMGSRAVLVLARDEDAVRRRFGIQGGGLGACFTRTGRRFFTDAGLEAAFLAQVSRAAGGAGLWDELATDWLCLDAELMPWSAKAQELLKAQYAPVGAAAEGALAETVSALSRAAERSADVGDLLARTRERAALVSLYRTAYRSYCWPVESVADLRLAPFHLLASEGAVHVDRDHLWHMDVARRLTEASEGLVVATRHLVVDVTRAESEAEGARWWEDLTARGGEGMVVKPLSFVARGRRGTAQPAVKCRGREYLRIVYGPEYSAPANLDRLRARGVSGKQSLAKREFALGIEALERFVRREPLRRVHECVFGVLALESEPVDPRL